MQIPDRVRRRLVAQAHNPTGPVGHLEGWLFGHRPSNVRRNRWAVELLEIKPSDRVIELGCGPGVAIAALARRATQGLIVGVDHSAVVLRQARRRNAGAIKEGRVRLIHASVENLQVAGGPFDAALAVNTVGMWPEPTIRLSEIGLLLRRGGRIALVSQPRCPGATAATSAAAGDRLRARLSEAGFDDTRVETLGVDPPAVCVLATQPRGAMPRPSINATMIVRIWRTGIDEARAHDYQEFARQRSLPMFRSQPGFAGVLFAARPGQRVVITLWADQTAVQALDASDTYQATVAAIEAQGFLRGNGEVEVFELDGGLIDQRFRGLFSVT
jgi:SAM-dependent methyltransferase